MKKNYLIIGGRSMELAVIGVDHHIAPMEIREKMSFTESKKEITFQILQQENIHELIIVSTCNRSELYLASEELEQSIHSVCTYLKEYTGQDDIEKHLFIKENRDAVYHIFQVAAGLESLVIGEDQILGQVKDALEYAIEKGHSGKLLNKLFRESITKAKYIKTTLKISENPTSVGYVGLKMLKKEMDSLEGKRALIIGAGNMGKLSLKYIIEENLDKVYITNRTHDKLNQLLIEFEGVCPVYYEDRYDLLQEVDILISTTASPHTLFLKENMPKLKKDLYILDLAMPRDVEKEVGELEGVHLYEIDDLRKVIDENIEYRKSLMEPIMAIIQDSVEEFYKWKGAAKLDPLIRKINAQCETIKMESLDYIYRKTNLTIKDKEVVEKMIHSALKRSIKPIVNLKSIDDAEKLDDYIAVMDEIFGK